MWRLTVGRSAAGSPHFAHTGGGRGWGGAEPHTATRGAGARAGGSGWGAAWWRQGKGRGRGPRVIGSAIAGARAFKGGAAGPRPWRAGPQDQPRPTISPAPAGPAARRGGRPRPGRPAAAG